MEWEKGKLTKATIHSALGGNCRIRTSEKITVDVPTSKIEGANPNTFYNFVDAGKPLVKENAQLLEMSVNQGNVIDFKTEKGKTYNIIPQK
jgi:alpha-L-fucosidase 2